jgi:hypothetical protein
MISVFRAPDSRGFESRAVVLSQDAIFLTAAGEPMPGVALHPAQAREVARRLWLLAQEIENRKLQSMQDS